MGIREPKSIVWIVHIGSTASEASLRQREEPRGPEAARHGIDKQTFLYCKALRGE